MDRIIFQAEGMACAHCENTVKKSVGKLDGVSSVMVDLKKKTVTVAYDGTKVSPGDIKRTIEGQGYGVV